MDYHRAALHRMSQHNTDIAAIHKRAVINQDMPLGNMTNMTEEERKTLAISIENYRVAKGK